MKKIFYDGSIFYKQKRGGVSANFLGILKRIGKNRDFECLCTFPSHNRRPDVRGIGKAIIPKIRPNRLYPFFWQWMNDLIVFFYRPDIFHSTYYSDSRYLRGAKTVLTVYDMIRELFPDEFEKTQNREFINLKRRLAYRADAIVCISESTRQDVLKIYENLSPRKVFVVHCAVDEAFLRPPEDVRGANRFLDEFGLGRPFFLYVGQIRDLYKNFDMVLDVYQSTPGIHSRFDLAVVCRDQPTDDQKRRLEGMKEKIKLFSRVHDADLRRFYSHCHAFVYPSKYEGFGIPILEAMACGAPVITASVSSMPEVGGNAALYFHPDSAEELRDCLIKVADDEELRAGLIEKGRRNVARFSWDRSVARLASIYARL